MSDIYALSDFFTNVLDIPSYYINVDIINIKYLYDYELYAIFDNDIKFFIISPQFKLFGYNTPVNSSIVLYDGEHSISMYLVIDDYTLLIINDIIKSNGGKLL